MPDCTSFSFASSFSVMSCLNLKRLLPHKKVWKMLHKLHFKLIRSKTTKKPKHRSYKASKKISWQSLSIQPKKFKKQPNLHTTIHHRCYFHKQARQPPPIFVDQLYVEPVSTSKDHVVSPGGTSKEKSKASETSLNKSQSLDLNSRLPESSNDGSRLPESSKEETNVVEVDADDAWESMVVASPQIHGINERAEEFIARFRAQMRQQELLARRL